MMEDQMLLGDILQVQSKELNRLHSGFSFAIASGFDYEKPMEKVLAELEKAWELISYAFESAWMIVDGDVEKYPKAWTSLEKLESLLRSSLTMGEVTLEKATVLLQSLGMMVFESERCQKLWSDQV